MTFDLTTTDHVAAQKLWDALREAGADRMPRSVAHVEDALFRFYLPLARTMARVHTPGGDDHDQEDTAQAAEVGLAQAILAWRHSDSSGFEAFARHAITTQLRRRDQFIRRQYQRARTEPHDAPDPAPDR